MSAFIIGDQDDNALLRSVLVSYYKKALIAKAFIAVAFACFAAAFDLSEQEKASL
jgi:hypothetical protein